jgi:2-polyprenyl-3-methyl-5-hydroxy-6-metoxy-1,4-benzoquinol methylase
MFTVNNPKCIVTLSFDDGYKETLDNVIPVLSKYNIKASFNVIAGYVSKYFEERKLADWKDLKLLTSMGHEISSHSYSHEPINVNFWNRASRFSKSFMNSKNRTQFFKRAIIFILSNNVSKKSFSVEREFVYSNECIEKRIPNYACSSFVYSGGIYKKESKKLLESVGYASARSLDIGFNNPNKLNLYALKTQIWDSSTTAEEANNWIDHAIKNGCWLIECFHLIGKENKENYLYFTLIEEFEKHMKYIKEKNCMVMTQKEAVEWINNIDKKFRNYSLKSIYFFDNKLPILLKKIFKSKKYRKAKIVDLGCGDGRLLSALKSKGYLNQKDSYGIDISEDRISYLREYLPEVKTIISDASDIKELDDNKFDVVICSQLIEHVPSEDLLIKEIKRLIKHDGLIYMSSVIKKRYGFWIYRVNGKIKLDPTHLREYSSEEEFLDLLDKNGVDCKEVQITPLRYSIVDLLLRLLIRLSILNPKGFQNFFLEHKLSFKIKNLLNMRVLGYYTIETISKVKD